MGRLLGLVDHERIASVRSGSTNRRVRYHLGRMQELLEKLGNPHRGIPTIHIAGTKGKGSTAAMCTNILVASGFSVGLFTSPHMHRFGERIQVSGAPVSEDEFASLVDAIWPAVEEIGFTDSQGGTTLFEALTAMAFVEFQKKANFQVIEVGLGGRLDTTNLVEPTVCAITSLSLDHTAVLGGAIEQIALEKAGIIKPRVPVVSAPQPAEAMSVIRSKCAAEGSPLVEVGADITWRPLSKNSQGQRFEVQGKLGSHTLEMPLLGDYQMENAAIVVGIAEELKDTGIPISDHCLESGFRTVSWPCRLEVLSREPLTVCDGAHNPYSVTRLLQTLPEYFEYDHLALIVGMSEDKNLVEMVGGFAEYQTQIELSGTSKTSQVIVTRSRHPRSAPCGKLASQFRQLSSMNIQEEPNVRDAVAVGQDIAVRYAHSNLKTLVLATGSLFVAAEAREVVLNIEPELYPEFEVGKNQT